MTHRAFCDALAEETARINGSTNITNSLGGGNINIGYSLMQNSLGPNMGTNFSSIFKPISCTDQETTRGLSLWMTQPSHAHDTMAINSSNLHDTGTIYNGGGNGNPLNASHSNSNNYQLNWVFGNNFSSINGSEDLTSNVSLPLVSNIVKDTTTNQQLISVPSLYSSQHQPQQHQTTSPNMSATALLQKAAQIGTTSSDPSFLGSLGLRCNVVSNSARKQDDGDKFCGLYGSSELENYSGDLSQIPSTKRRHVQNEESAWGQTRDFLGVGGANHLTPFINQRMDFI